MTCATRLGRATSLMTGRQRTMTRRGQGLLRVRPALRDAEHDTVCSNSCRNNRRARNGRLVLPGARGAPLPDESLRALRETALDELVCAAESGAATMVHLQNVARLVRRVDERLSRARPRRSARAAPQLEKRRSEWSGPSPQGRAAPKAPRVLGARRARASAGASPLLAGGRAGVAQDSASRRNLVV